MKNRFLKILFVLPLLAASFCNINNGGPGIAVLHTDKVHVSFDITTNETLTQDSGFFNLDSIRNEMNSGHIIDSTFGILNITISVDTTDSASRRIVAGDAGIHLLATGWYSTPVSSWALFLQTPDSGAFMSQLSSGTPPGLAINRDLFGDSPGFLDFNSALQNSSTSELGLMVKLVPLQTPPDTGVLKAILTIYESALTST